jgi:hypothetical protein
MYTIIPLNEQHINLLRNIDYLNYNDMYIVGINFMSKLLAIEKYPINNKKIAIKNILKFMRLIDIKMKINDETLIKIYSHELVKIFTTKHYKRYMDLLKKLEVITVVPYNDNIFYVPTQRTSQYRIHTSYMNDSICIVIGDKKNNILLNTDKNSYKAKFKKAITYITADFKSAILDELEHNKIENKTINNLRLRLNTLLSLNSSRFIKKGNKVDRIYHSVTNISKVARKHLSIDGVKFHDIDVKNCQPLLLCYYLRKNNMPIDDKYQYDCEMSQFYEQFMLNNITRSEAKTLVYKNILFDFKVNSETAKVFKQLYPKTYNSLKELNQSTSLASELQNLEASIFNVLEPNKSKYFYTLFDSIYFTNINDCVHLMNDIKSKFGKYNINVMVTVNGETEYDTEDLID